MHSKSVTEVLAAATAQGVARLDAQMLLLHALGQLDDAEEAYVRAQQLGLPATRVLPYLAELSFAQRDFEKTRQLMQQLDEWSALPRLRPVIDYWSAR